MSAFELKDTELCVMCGLCLPHCPTYVITRDEGDSPRGRIALMQALGQEIIDSGNERLAFHIDRCLGCRACEAMCPSHVPFMDLMDHARAKINLVQGLDRYGAPAKQLLGMAASPAKMRLASAAAGGIGFLMRHAPLSGNWARARDLLPGSSNESLHLQPTPGKGKPAYLFTGCMGDLAERETLKAAGLLLAALGHEVLRSESAGCCGAMHRHAGQPQQADELKQINLEAFEEYPEAPIVSVASGCSAELSSYPEAYSERHFEVMAYLASFEWPEDIGFAPLDEQVAIHIPCTQRNVLKDKLSTRILLERIPGIALSELPLSSGCCGAGGLNMLSQPEIGEALLDASIEWLSREQPRYVVSTNIGCTLHMQVAIRKAGLSCEVVHPLWLLARQCKAQ